MLPRSNRLHRPADFRTVIRRGRRAGGGTMVVHALLPTADAVPDPQEPGAVRVGLVVSKAVGGSVARHRVSRRLRHVAAARLSRMPEGAAVVLRALPAAAEADSDRLAADFDRCWTRLAERWDAAVARPGPRESPVAP